MNGLLKSQFVRDMFLDGARHALTIVGTYLIAHGIMQSSQSNDFLGSGFFLASLVWQAWENWGNAIQSSGKPLPGN